MRIWECDKCFKQIRSMNKPLQLLDMKVYYKAQSKGGKSVGFHLCNKCFQEYFPKVAKQLEKEVKIFFKEDLKE